MEIETVEIQEVYHDFVITVSDPEIDSVKTPNDDNVKTVYKWIITVIDWLQNQSYFTVIVTKFFLQ